MAYSSQRWFHHIESIERANIEFLVRFFQSLSLLPSDSLYALFKV